ncbi:sensor histidine kinase [Cryptosporangium aurantiacum]|uniref:histidine kinase n=1 Tax=Cryptosporangium aurantiacum TaxID=134849 RepID=A0A1M7RJZ7_9ACTN|nr:histidine kinase [Cryptosporangium aurantiacum]SHN46481.1 Signal transduction histidine kinase [Cryptosporangium aurantiacum]
MPHLLTDLAPAGLLLVWAVIEALAAAGPGSTGQRLLFAVAVTVPLVARRRAPLAVVAVLVLVLWVRVQYLPGLEESTFPFPSLLVATYSAAVYARVWWGALLAGCTTVAVMIAALPLGYYEGPITVGQFFILGFFVAGAGVGGWLVRLRMTQATAARSESAQRAEEAVAVERARIAREIHDVVAHSLSIVAVQAGAAESLIEADPDVARAHIAAARQTAREALAEMRHVLDVTRQDASEPDAAELAPQPTLERVPELVAELRAAGLPVSLTVDGARGDVPAGVDLAAYRIIQEALTNVRRHAGTASTEVRIGYDREEITIDVANTYSSDAAGSGRDGTGRGLVGMRERARLYGGSLQAGVDGSRFAVRARLPRVTA